jgi:hypothetical protein
MKIIQSRYLFFTLLLSAFFVHFSSQGQTSGHRLKTADSLFQAKRYTQSLAHYEEILAQRQYTPAMLLKMAYIHEGLNQTGQAIYYLNLYHLVTGDEAVAAKMNDLARKYNLEGYQTSGSDRFYAYYRDNRLNISLALAAISLFFLSLMFLTRVRLHKRPLASGVGLLVCLIGLATHLFLFQPPAKAVIASETTYLMTGPSAGAGVIDIVGNGHRVEIVGKEDIWLKVRWANRTAYVKEAAVRRVEI